MAEMHFSIVAVSASLLKKSIFVECSLDVDEDTVDSSNVILLDKTTNTIELFEAETDEKIIQLKLRNDPQPGHDYTLLVQPGIESVVGDRLETAFMRTFQFMSEVVSRVELLRPADFEKIDAIKLEWQEVGNTLTGSFQWQVAKENAFYNIAYETTVTGSNSIELPVLPEGQYYVRGRAVKGDEYGCWSGTKTFMYVPKPAEPSDEPAEPPTEEVPSETPAESDTPPEIDFDGPTIIVDVEELAISEEPTNGVTPASGSFAIAFDDDIDITDIEISAYRSDF